MKKIPLLTIISAISLMANIKLYHIDDGRFCTKEELKIYNVDKSKIIYTQNLDEKKLGEKWGQFDMRPLGDPYIITCETSCSFEKYKKCREEVELFIDWRKSLEKFKK